MTALSTLPVLTFSRFQLSSFGQCGIGRVILEPVSGLITTSKGPELEIRFTLLLLLLQRGPKMGRMLQVVNHAASLAMVVGALHGLEVLSDVRTVPALSGSPPAAAVLLQIGCEVRRSGCPVFCLRLARVRVRILEGHIDCR